MSKFLKRIITFTGIALILMQQQTVAQQDNPIGKISIASPTAASLGKYGDIPVNYHTGIPQISIPIYTASAGPLSLPVSLSYHASGLKVQEPASWVGAGWALNSGGVITRTVVGTPDERRTNNAGVAEKGHFSDYGYNNYLSGIYPEDWQPFAEGRRDGEPDLFFFNFGSYSGKFYFRDDRTPVIVPEADFKIEPYYTEVSNTSIQSFIITTPDGVKYYFGNTPGLTGTTPIEITKPSTFTNGLSSANVISSWYLNKVATADDQFAITLNYQPENYGYHTISMFPIDGLPTGGLSASFGSTHGYDLVKNIVQGVRLSQIVFPNGTINFIEAASARTDLSDISWSPNTDGVNLTVKSLGAIQINDAVNTPLKKFNFTYSYFTDNITPLPTDIQNFAPNLQTDKQRLKLDQVQEVSGDGSITKPPHYFTYFNEQVPRRLSFGIDHWGFSNGVTGNQTPIPTYTLFGPNSATVYPGGDRDAYWPAMRGGTLQQINYPTGGYSLFEFEPHSVYNTNTSTVNATLANFWIHLYSQGTITNTVPVAIVQYNPINIAISNTSNYGATFTLTNSSNVVVYNTPIGNNTPSFQNTLTLPQDTYQATISLPQASNITGGTSVTITQIQTVQTTNTVTIGGNRIKTITHNDGVTANNIITSYSYTQDNPLLSSAILYSRPAYVGIVRNDIIKDIGYFNATGALVPNPFGPYGCITTPAASYYKSPSSIRPMATTQGNHIGYAQVKVAQTGNGYSLYKYYGATGVPPWLANPGDIAIRTLNNAGCDANAPNYPPAPLPFDFMRGELKYQAQYNEAGQMLKETNYTPAYQESTVFTPAFIVVRSGANYQMLGTKYQIGTSKKISDAITEKVYNPADGNYLTTTSTTYYESPFHHQATRTVTTNSQGTAIETKMKYAFDIRLSTCDGIADGYPQYSNTYSSCNGTYVTAKLSCGSNGQCQGNAYLNFITCATNARINYVNYRKTNFTNSTNTFQTYHNTAKTSADAELKPILQLQDNYENPVIETTKWKNGNLLGASFSRYDYSTVPAGKVYINKVQAINLSATTATFTNAATNATNNGIVKDTRYKDESFVKFYNGNLAEITGKDGVTTSYLWGYNNTLPVAKAIGTDQTTLLNAYTAVGGNLATLRSQFPANTVQLNTYVYTPIVGMISETDVNGKSITYEYDKLQRLLLARDFNNNILKQYDYKYQVTPPNATPQWLATGNTRCKPCPQNNIYITNILQQEEKDNNPASGTYNNLRWTDIGTSTACVSNASWQNTASAIRCRLNASSQNTGEQEQQQSDINPCSLTYGLTQWVVVGINTTACPLPVSTCNTSNCTGEGNKCINGVCQFGIQLFRSAVKNIKTGLWTCVYYYKWSDNSISADYTVTSASPCNA
jgi:hypothetical protein